MSLSDQERYALFAKSVYRMNDPLKSKETRMADAMSVISDGGVTGFDMDRSESNSKRGVFVNNDTKEVIISHRGTDPSMAANLTTDAAIALGVEGFTRRYKNARDRDRETILKYPDHKVSLTGHSLGANISTNSSIANNVPAHVFNAGSGLLNFSHFLKPKKQKRNITHYTTVGDPLSLTAKLKPTKQVFVAQKGMNPHSLDNFIK